jgi:hypothetical protein
VSAFLRLFSVLALAWFVAACAARRPASTAAGAAREPVSAPPVAAVVEAAKEARAAELVRWVEDAPAEAGRWLARQPAEPAFDAALCSLATHPEVVVPHPEFAVAQAARIIDDGLRLAVLAEVVSTWARIDADTARARVARLERIDGLERAHLNELLADAAAE